MPQMAAGGKSGPNKLWDWRGYSTRYTSLNEQIAPEDAPSVVLVHGLFSNADHWRKNGPELASAGCRVFAIDLLGSGYSSKPSPMDPAAVSISGERRFSSGDGVVLVNDLGTASGAPRRGGPFRVSQLHPCVGSPYNFFTFAEQLVDFTEQVVLAGRAGPVALICNSIGCITGLQAMCDRPELFSGACLVAPNFRELHVAESPALARPVVKLVQAALRKWGSTLFDYLATPDVVRAILSGEPYNDKSAVTDELVDALLAPLLLPGSADVVFDNLSYSAGPLPEQLLQDPALAKPIYVCYGTADPWTPTARVEALSRFPSVRKVLPLVDSGHCPMDESPQLVNAFVLDFLRNQVHALQT